MRAGCPGPLSGADPARRPGLEFEVRRGDRFLPAPAADPVSAVQDTEEPPCCGLGAGPCRSSWFVTEAPGALGASHAAAQG